MNAQNGMLEWRRKQIPIDRIVFLSDSSDRPSNLKTEM